MKKLWLVSALVLLCAFLSGCAVLEAPGEDVVLADINRYYQHWDDNLADSEREMTLGSAAAVHILEQEVDSRDQTARIRCRTQVQAENGTFSRSDVWEHLYSYDKSIGMWELKHRICLETEYELLSDLPEELCLALLGDELGEGRTLVSLATDRTALSAMAVYTYETETAQLDSYGKVTLNAVVDAAFRWDSAAGWQYEGSALSENSEYRCDLRCHVVYDGSDMLYTDRFNMEFDLVVIDNMVCIENLYYQGSVCTLGEMHIGNANVVAVDDGAGVQIVFDYVRDAEYVRHDKNYIDSAEYKAFYKTISGTGTVTVREGDDGEITAQLYLPGFVAWHNDQWSDFESGKLPIQKVGEKNWNRLPSDELPAPTPTPTIPTPEVDIVTGGEERTAAGEWTFTAPEGSGVSGNIEARLEENRFCLVYCALDLITLRDTTTYRVVDAVFDLPTDLLSRIVAGMGNMPEIAVVYDAERDILITCLEKGVYIYFSRVESGNTGGIYQPE